MVWALNYAGVLRATNGQNCRNNKLEKPAVLRALGNSPRAREKDFLLDPAIGSLEQ